MRASPYGAHSGTTASARASGNASRSTSVALRRAGSQRCSSRRPKESRSHVHEASPRSARRRCRASIPRPSVSSPPDDSIRIVPLHETSSKEVYEVDMITTADVPTTDEITDMPYDEWLEMFWRRPTVTLDGSFAAIVDGRVVGIHAPRREHRARARVHGVHGDAPRVSKPRNRRSRQARLPRVGCRATAFGQRGRRTTRRTRRCSRSTSASATRPRLRRVEYLRERELAQRERLLHERGKHLRRDPHRRRRVRARVAVAAVGPAQAREVRERPSAAASRPPRRTPGSRAPSTARRARARRRDGSRRSAPGASADTRARARSARPSRLSRAAPAPPPP